MHTTRIVFNLLHTMFLTMTALSGLRCIRLDHVLDHQNCNRVQTYKGAVAEANCLLQMKLDKICTNNDCTKLMLNGSKQLQLKLEMESLKDRDQVVAADAINM
ncbi:hypothetical protein L1987_10869 [Smallanthus sonchifolius]|uniref:Uncharacterized protein n=1 Tax=Smallanthus sonchifolius TaxID=185202 RepID=A0ACB9JAB5_9ASTR|nr:hypothetical protein L1987_10869 [Smallanthus sonchifolius]